MAYLNDKFKKARLDQSPYLFHFIKGSDPDPLGTLKKILEEKRLISKYGRICFSASPLTSITKFFDEKCNSTGMPLYHPCGIGFSRDVLVKNYQARNVIYVDAEEREKVPEEFIWRTDILEVDSYDFEYLREWRIKGNVFDFSEISFEDILVIAPDLEHLNDLVVKYEWIFKPIVDYENGYVDPDWDEEWKRAWKGVAVDVIRDAYQDDFAMSKATSSQIEDQDMFKELFGDSLFMATSK